MNESATFQLNMNEKLGSGFVIVAIIAVTILAGCAEEAPMPTPTPTLMPSPTPTHGVTPSPSLSPKNEQSVIRFCIIEYGHKNIMIRNGSPLIENSILRYADHLFRKGGNDPLREREGGSGITYWGGASPIIRGNIIYSNTHNLEIGSYGMPIIENNVIAFGQKRGEYFGGANGIRTWSDEGTTTFRNNLIYRNRWGIEFNWGSKASVKNNIIAKNDVGLVCWQGDPEEIESHPLISYNTVWGNRINYSKGTLSTGHGYLLPGDHDISVDPLFTDFNFYNTDFIPQEPMLRDSDIGPNWDWSWGDPDIL
ncbi:MAG: right-handed parallel beta-helix repeat-containing protein [archaeon]|nr:right-handed parallel beta-helix repeat-containing protein [archaeon]